MKVIAVLYWLAALACLLVIADIAIWTYTWNVGAWRMFWSVAEMMIWLLGAAFLVYLGMLAKRKAEGNFNFKGSLRREKEVTIVAGDLGPIIPNTSATNLDSTNPARETARAISFDKSNPNGNTMRHTPSLRNARKRKEEAARENNTAA